MKKLVAAILALLTALSLAVPVLAQPDKPVEVVVVVVIVVVCDDAWGNHLYVTDSHIARVNPITYRGYYFDWETGLFYLQSRYYCPNLRRFISADVYLDTNQGVLGTNMYAYCLNNPVNRIDPDGFRSQAITYEQHRREVQAGGSFILGVLTLYLLTQAPTAPAPPRPRVQTQTQTRTQTRTLVGERTTTRLPLYRERVYYLAYINTAGRLEKVGQPMTFVGAMGALGITGASHTLRNIFQYDSDLGSRAQRTLEGMPNIRHSPGRSYWGIYTQRQDHAQALALVFGITGRPELHIGSGQRFFHFHDLGHNFHIWFGDSIHFGGR